LEGRNFLMNNGSADATVEAFCESLSEARKGSHRQPLKQSSARQRASTPGRVSVLSLNLGRGTHSVMKKLSHKNTNKSFLANAGVPVGISS